MRLALFLSVAFLFSFGLLMVFNTTSAEIIDRSLDVDTHGALYRQILYGIGGLVAGAIAYWWGYESILRWSTPLLAGGTLLLALVFVPGIGQMINGSRRWIGLFGFTFQPSECAKILIPAAYIRWALCQKGEIGWLSFLKILGALFIPLALIFFEPDNGAIAILFSLLVVLFFLSRVRLVYWALPLFILMGIGAVIAYQMPYVKSRIQVYLHPELDLKGKGHQPHQAKIAAGSGKLWGRGLGESLQKLNYLPEARSDYIAAIYAEETGFIGILGLIAAYGILTAAGFAVALRAKDPGGFLFAAILTFLISFQAFLNLGVVSGLLPSKGMNLPFFSQGGSSLVANMVALFLLFDIERKRGVVDEAH